MHDYTGIFLNFFLNLNSDWPLLFLIILPIERDWVQKEKYNDLFVRLFDNPLSKYFTFKIISCMQWLFWVIYQYYRGLGLAFAAHSLDDFSKNVLYLILNLCTKFQFHISFSSQDIKQNVLLSYLDNWWRHEFDLSSIILQSNGRQVEKEGRREYKKLNISRKKRAF